jgi:hypothetical protein
MLCRRSRIQACPDDDYQIESSTDVRPCKKRPQYERHKLRYGI